MIVAAAAMHREYSVNWLALWLITDCALVAFAIAREAPNYKHTNITAKRKIRLINTE